MTRVELWVEARDGVPAVNPVMRSVLDALAGEGVDVRVRVPEWDPPGGGPVADLVLLKSMTTLALAAATAGEAAGGRFLNPAATTVRVQDKAETVARLAAAGLPVPATFLLDPGGPAPRGAGGEPGAWVTKPVLGWHGRGVRHHGSLARACAGDGPSGPVPGTLVDDGVRLVQRHVGGAGPDLKVYVAGDRVLAAAKDFRPGSYADDTVRPVEPDAAVGDVVRRVGAVLDLRIYGVDLRAGPSGPVIVDVNAFPGFRGLPASVPALCAEIRDGIRAGTSGARR